MPVTDPKATNRVSPDYLDVSGGCRGECYLWPPSERPGVEGCGRGGCSGSPPTDHARHVADMGRIAKTPGRRA